MLPGQAKTLLLRLGYEIIRHEGGVVVFRNRAVPADRGVYACDLDPYEEVPVRKFVSQLEDEAGINRDLIFAELDQMGL